MTTAGSIAREPAVGRAPATVCGVGAVTGYGWGRKRLWDGLESGESAVVRSTGWKESLGHDVAYMAKIADVPHEDPRSRFARATETAVDEAIDDATERGWKPGPVVGLIHAIVLGEVDGWREFYLEQNQRVSRSEYLRLMPSTIMSMQMQAHGFHGPAMAVNAMCASGNAAMLTAKMWLDAGVVQRRGRRRHRPVGHARQHPPLRQPRRALRRPAPVRGVPALPDRQLGLPRGRGECGLRPLPPARARVPEGARRRDDARRLPRRRRSTPTTPRSGGASSSRSPTPASTRPTCST